MTWEYHYAELPVNDQFAVALNEQGKQGWELLTCVQGLQPPKLAGAQPRPVWVCIFKRQAVSNGTAERSRLLAGPNH